MRSSCINCNEKYNDTIWWNLCPVISITIISRISDAYYWTTTATPTPRQGCKLNSLFTVIFYHAKLRNVLVLRINLYCPHSDMSTWTEHDWSVLGRTVGLAEMNWTIVSAKLSLLPKCRGPNCPWTNWPIFRTVFGRSITNS